MTAYGFLASLVGVRTLEVIGDDHSTFYWSVAVCLASIGALVGVIRSAAGKSHTTEMVMTLALLALLAFYGTAMFIRGLQPGDHAFLASSFLPLIISVFPYTRLVGIARRSDPK
jgi:hypothetical protein